jgi:Ca2+-binding EF-hand superfamily protein
LGGDFRFDASARSEQSSGPAMLTAGSEQVEMTASGFVDAASGERSNMIANLKQFDQDQNDYLDEREARQIGQLNFKMLDANGDGKLFFDEIGQYIDAQAAAAAVRLVIGVVDHDHALFEALDTNGDQQLGRRELGRLAGRLKTWDRDGDGQLAFDEVPRRYTLRVAQDQPQLPFDEPYSLAYTNVAAVGSQPKSAPAWFTEMDRNSDGDVSRREFLGTAAQFRKIDADGDALIDPDEATRATPVQAPVVEKAAAGNSPSSGSTE